MFCSTSFWCSKLFLNCTCRFEHSRYFEMFKLLVGQHSWNLMKFKRNKATSYPFRYMQTCQSGRTFLLPVPVSCVRTHSRTQQFAPNPCFQATKLNNSTKNECVSEYVFFCTNGNLTKRQRYKIKLYFRSCTRTRYVQVVRFANKGMSLN